MSDPKVIYLGPACEADTGDGRTWAEDDPWPTCDCGHKPVRYVLGEDFDRLTAERDALQLRLNAADERADRLDVGIKWESERNALLLASLTEAEDMLSVTSLEAGQRLTAAEQRIANQVKLLREWDAMWNGGGIHNGPLTKLREATRSALANDAGSFELVPCPSLQRERDMFEEWAAEESEIRGVGETIGLSTDEHHDRYSMIWTQTSWMAWQARAALKPTESGASE